MEEYFFRYLRLGEIIAKQQEKLKMPGRDIYLGSWHTRVVYDDLGASVYAPKILQTLELQCEQIEAVHRCLKRNQQRLKYFNAYLDTVDEKQRKELLKGHYSDEALAEIYEIETAIAFQQGYELPTELVPGEERDLFEDIASLADLF